MLGQLLAFLGVALLVIVVPGPDTALTVRNALTGGRRSGVATAAGVATGQAVWTVATSVGIAELIQRSEPAFLALKLAGAAYLVALGIQSLRSAARPSLAGRWTGTHRPFRDLWTAARIPFPGRLRSPTGGPGTGPGGLRPTPGGVCTGPGGVCTGPGGVRTGPGGMRAAPGRVQAAPGGSRVTPGGSVGPGRAFRQGVVSNLANPKMAAFFLSLLPQFVGPGRGAGRVMALGLVFCLMTFGWLALYSVVVDRARVVLGRSRVRRALEGVSGVVLVGFGARLALEQR